MAWLFKACRMIWDDQTLFRRIEKKIKSSSSKTSKCSMQFAAKRGTPGIGIRIRPWREADIPQLMEFRRELGVHDATTCFQTWLTIDPQGIQVAETELGDIISTCGMVKQNDDMYFAGMFYVHKDYRGTGIGIQISNVCLEHASGANASLNAVPGIMEKYRDRSGFSTVETEFKCIKNITSRPVNPYDLSGNLPQGVTIEPFSKWHLPYIFAYDSSLVGYEREQVLEMSCQEHNSRTFVAFRNGLCVGFGSIKMSCLGAGRVGPLYADDSAVAEVLLRSLIISLPCTTSFAMMTVSTNIASQRFLKILNCPKVEELTRLYKYKKMSVDTGKVFALFDLTFTPF